MLCNILVNISFHCGLLDNVSYVFCFVFFFRLYKQAHCPTLWPAWTDSSLQYTSLKKNTWHAHTVVHHGAGVTIHHMAFTSTWWMVALQLLLNKLDQNRLLEHLSRSCGCNFAAVVTQCDKLTCVFKSLFPGHVSFHFKCCQCPSPLMLMPCCQCHLALLFRLFSIGGWHLHGWCLLLFHKCLFLCDC